jgi:hypothetical protein
MLRPDEIERRENFDCRHLWRWLCRVYALPGVQENNQLVCPQYRSESDEEIRPF